MPKVLITGMSGTGKSSALRALAARGHRTVDTDTDEWSRWVTLPDGSRDWVWREEAIAELLAGHDEGALFVAGCRSNQGRFYPRRTHGPDAHGPGEHGAREHGAREHGAVEGRFDHVVLLSAPADVILARIRARTDNPYGKRPEERAAILNDLVTVEPLLRATATAEIDATAPLGQVVRRLEELIEDRRTRPR
ncbi:shikimate kinase [Nonomuraea mesophila]|uniref:Shikimate kinase n=1 Tax=Nonomuraea mesophila TaxID=2530382 RepID=A0A4R5FVN7_9ACTN|nr:AAA family ATPase [Nonomuraea mesophila]TDE57630.1 shikimate kinase [Nonomuraea mesophila]